MLGNEEGYDSIPYLSRGFSVAIVLHEKRKDKGQWRISCRCVGDEWTKKAA